MKEITVNYLIDDKTEARLEALKEYNKKQGYDFTIERLFESIMCYGSKYDIHEKLNFHEWQAGIISEEEYQARLEDYKRGID